MRPYLFNMSVACVIYALIIRLVALCYIKGSNTELNRVNTCSKYQFCLSRDMYAMFKQHMRNTLVVCVVHALAIRQEDLCAIFEFSVTLN